MNLVKSSVYLFIFLVSHKATCKCPMTQNPWKKNLHKGARGPLTLLYFWRKYNRPTFSFQQREQVMSLIELSSTVYFYDFLQRSLLDIWGWLGLWSFLWQWMCLHWKQAVDVRKHSIIVQWHVDMMKAWKGSLPRLELCPTVSPPLPRHQTVACSGRSDLAWVERPSLKLDWECEM